ncbi:MAG: hypothetical protein FD123_2513 [Bacteroidetes bacterium]|nr:MAG: hypothetical protein FD123_2513 [Bacteroidota bacterium]
MKHTLTLPAFVFFFSTGLLAQNPVTPAPVPVTPAPQVAVKADFQAVYSNGKVILSWTGLPDCCSDYYIIERSKNGVDFSSVLQVAGPKTVCPYTEYFETDQNPFAGSSFYRLRMVTREGQTAFSNTIPVNLVFDQQKGVFTTSSGEKDNKNLKVELKGFGNQEVLVVLMNTKGDVVLSKVQLVAEGASIVVISTESKLEPGDYIVTASAKNEIFSQKITVQ